MGSSLLLGYRTIADKDRASSRWKCWSLNSRRVSGILVKIFDTTVRPAVMKHDQIAMLTLAPGSSYGIERRRGEVEAIKASRAASYP
jgi:hypothetical protein